MEGDVYRPQDPKISILISAGTGFPRQFYHTVASCLASRGAIVMTYDYRGIGGSNTDEFRFLDIDYPDWGRLDTPAALDSLIGDCAGIPVTHLAHSVGGHFIGLMPNHSQITRHAFVSVGTGYFAGHHLTNIPKELFFGGSSVLI
ncbi:MAG: alpha/beta hydrolase [Pseudomonadota bacterium]